MGETREGRAPVELPGAREELGGALEGRSELRIARPEREELHDRRERGDVGLGRGHTLLDPGAERDQIVGELRERGVPGIHERHDASARGARVAHGREQVGARARLGDHEHQRSGEIRLRLVHGAHRRGRGGGEEPEARLDEVAGEGGGVIGAAARAGHDGARRGLSQPLREAREACGIGAQLRAHHRGRLGCLAVHTSASRLRRVHEETLSSATKS